MPISWKSNYSTRENQEMARTYLSEICAIPEDNTELRVAREPREIRNEAGDVTETRHANVYLSGSLKPSGFEQAVRAATRSQNDKNANRATLDQAREDIEKAFGTAIVTDFQNEFFSRLQSGSPLTKGALMRFLEKHNLVDQLPPIATEANPSPLTIENGGALGIPLATASRVDDDGTNVATEADSIEQTIAVAINDQADPNFGHDAVPINAPSIIDLDQQR